MKTLSLSLLIVLMSCKTTALEKTNQDFPPGKYKVITLKDDNFTPLKEYFVSINVEEQRLGGMFDCNSYTVEYERDGSTIDFGYAISTKMFCEGKMENENAFFGILNAIKSFKYQDDILKFLDENDDLVLELKYVKDE